MYLTAIIMSFLAEGGLNTLGQRAGDFEKFLLKEFGIEDPTEFEDFLQLSLQDASAMFPKFIKAKEAKKRARRS